MTILSSGGNAEMDFVKCGKYYTNTTKYAFDWYLKTIATTQDSLMILQYSGNLEVSGTITSPTITAIQTQINGAGYLINNNTWTGTNTFTGTISGITKAMVGLTNVDNTSDLNKPVSTATTTQLNLKANLASPTFTGTVSGITKAMVGLTY